MTNRIRATGALALAGALIGGGAFAGSAAAHPNLAVDTAIGCVKDAAGNNTGKIRADFRVGGIDQGTSVAVSYRFTVNGQKVIDAVDSPWSSSESPSRAAEAGFSTGTATASITSEGKTDTAGGTFDCTPPPTLPTPAPTPKTPEQTPTEAETCATLRVKYPLAGPNLWRDHGCAIPTTPTRIAPRRHPGVCVKPATLTIGQQQSGTIFTRTYPLSVRIRNTTGAPTPRGVVILTDSGLQNFLTRSGERTERLRVPIGPMRRGQVRTFRGTMGFVGPQAYLRTYRTDARYRVILPGGETIPCGAVSDWAYEG